MYRCKIIYSSAHLSHTIFNYSFRVEINRVYHTQKTKTPRYMSSIPTEDKNSNSEGGWRRSWGGSRNHLSWWARAVTKKFVFLCNNSSLQRSRHHYLTIFSTPSLVKFFPSVEIEPCTLGFKYMFNPFAQRDSWLEQNLDVARTRGFFFKKKLFFIAASVKKIKIFFCKFYSNKK
jgi:hypothetical protein